MTSLPSSRNFRAKARPMPAEPPVIRIVPPVSFMRVLRTSYLSQINCPSAGGFAHPDRRHRRFRLDLRAAYEHQFHMADEGAGREAPAPIPVDPVVRHAPLHRSLEVR